MKGKDLKVAMLIKKDGNKIKQKHKLTNVHSLEEAQLVVDSLRAYAQHLQAQIIREELEQLSSSELEQLVSSIEDDARYGEGLLVILEDDGALDSGDVYFDERGMPHLRLINPND